MSDLIDRQQAIDAMCSACGYDCDKSEFVYNAPQDEQVIMCPEHYALSTLPSAEPEKRIIAEVKINKDDLDELVYDKVTELMEGCKRKKGKWITLCNHKSSIITSKKKCNQCGKESPRPWGYFCRWCGADMRGEQE